MSESDAGPDAEGPGGRTGADDESRPESPGEWVRWFLHTDQEAVTYLREVLSSVGAVLLVGLVLFAVSGLWPPMVAVESPSMKPNLKTGDLVFVMEEHRLAAPAAYADTGVVTYRTGQQTGYTKFDSPGDVIVYRPNGAGDGVTPIIHRAMFYVNESENWYDKAVTVDPHAVGSADNCRELRHCPAPHAGFITKGDNEDTNRHYDQVTGLSDPVRPAWVVGTAEFRIPWLGNIRLLASGTLDGGAGDPWRDDRVEWQAAGATGANGTATASTASGNTGATATGGRAPALAAA